jgi:hypothetical protein
MQGNELQSEHEVGDTAVYFSDDIRKLVLVPTKIQDWDCILEPRKMLRDPFLDLGLRSLVLRAPDWLRDRIHVVSSNLTGILPYYLVENKDSWEWLGDMGLKFFQGCSGQEDTLVVPYMDKQHWSLAIVEDKRTMLVGTRNVVHDTKAFDDFVMLVSSAWGIVRGFRPGSSEWVRLVARKWKNVEWPNQRSDWECGYMLIVMLWQYLQYRGLETRDPVAFEKADVMRVKWLDWNGELCARFLLQLIYCETARLDHRHPKPRFVLDLAEHQLVYREIEAPTWARHEGGRTIYGLDDVLGPIRDVQDVNVEAPPFPEKEEAHETRARVEADKKARRDNLEKLRSLRTNVEPGPSNVTIL